MTDHTVFPDGIRIGVSACLLGRQVRFDGGHKRNHFVSEVLDGYFELVPFCPEVAIGMGTPRRPIRLVGDPDAPQAVGVRDNHLNVTEPLRDYGRTVAQRMDDLCGFVFKKDSPSCGMTRVKLYPGRGQPQRAATGLFAAEIMRAHPLLPVEEEGRLNDPALRENFIMRVYVYARFQALLRHGLTRSALLRFHARHKYLLMAHDTEVYRALGRQLADLRGAVLENTAASYFATLMQALARPSTRKRHSNVLQHLLGYLKKDLDPERRRDLVETIEAYRNGAYPLVVPLRLLRHHFRSGGHRYVDEQVYLSPHPESMGLRNAL